MASLLPNASLCYWDRFFLALSGLYGAVAVGLSAYRAHGLKKSLQANGIDAEEIAERVANLATAVDVSLLHTVAIVAVIALSVGRLKYLTCLAFASGIFLFGGSLACHSIWRLSLPSLIAPAGGFLLIAGWLWLFVVACCRQGAKTSATC